MTPNPCDFLGQTNRGYTYLLVNVVRIHVVYLHNVIKALKEGATGRTCTEKSGLIKFTKN